MFLPSEVDMFRLETGQDLFNSIKVLLRGTVLDQDLY
jgi:hypothetical protein